MTSDRRKSNFIFQQVKVLYLTFLFLFSGIFLVHGQGLKGVVTDSKTNEGLPFANIYIDNTTIGTTSDEKGAFVFQELPPGFAVLVVSYVGYKTQSLNIKRKTNEVLEVSIALTPDSKQLGEIQVNATRDKEWEKKYKVFEKEFLGTTGNAKKTKILNPWVIEFIETDAMLMAQSDVPLEIENLGLGYSLSFLIRRFESSKKHFVILGSAKFKEMVPTDEKQHQAWIKNRIDAYQGAEQHLFRSMIHGNIGKEGFELFIEKKKGMPIARSGLFNQELGNRLIPFNFSMMPGKSETYRLMLPARLEVHYINDVEHNFYRDIPYRVFWIESEQLVVEVNSKGVLKDPTSILTTGYTRTLRVADMLPTDYEPVITRATVSNQ